jgi:hypothetical protein
MIGMNMKIRCQTGSVAMIHCPRSHYGEAVKHRCYRTLLECLRVKLFTPIPPPPMYQSISGSQPDPTGDQVHIVGSGADCGHAASRRRARVPH